ncbi:MAG: M15 family metallopeptidase [Clostridia bacterium]|nr:M15 family metallopeptidase [Clostridia bacterium]
MTSKVKKIRAAALLLALLCCLGGCIQLPKTEPSETAGSGETPKEEVTVGKHHETAVYTYSTEVDEETLKTGLSKEYLLLANKNCVLGEDYVPENLVSLPRAWTTRSMKLERRAAAALSEMVEEMLAAGVSDTYVTSAYRTYAYQQARFDEYRANEMKDITEDAYAVLGYDHIYNKYLVNHRTGLDAQDAERVVLSYSARPGTSEHQTGLCVDFITEGMGGKLDASFENYEAYTWLSQNAYRFGFILRYPKDKTEITGYQYEPWHYRFVGREAATDIYFSGLTLEEYLSATAS